MASIKPPAAGREEHADLKVTGLRLRVGAGGQKTWILRRRVGPKVVNRKLGTYPAMRLAGAREAALKLCEAWESEGGLDRAQRTFGAAAKAWHDKKQGDRQRNKSLPLQWRRLEIHVLPKWRDRRLLEIRRSDVRELLEPIEGQVLPNRVLTLLRTIFRFALSRDWIENSPAEGIDKLLDEAPRERFLDMAEARAVWSAADHLGYPSAGFIKLLLLTGQRRSEVASMRWDQLDLEAATWTLQPADTKANRGHLVPLSTEAARILSSTPKLGPFVWSTDGKTHVKGFAKIKSALDRLAAARPGGELREWRLHDLRRTVATHMVRLGVSELLVGRILNHAPQGVTAKVYALHSYEEEKRQALERWSCELLAF